MQGLSERARALRGCQTIDKVGRFGVPIKSANKNLLSVIQKWADFFLPIKSSDFVVKHRTRSVLGDKIGQLFGYRSPMVSVYSGK